MENLLTTRQIQDILRVDRITVYRMLKDGRLRGFKVGGQWRFPRRDIEAWLQEQQAGIDSVLVPPLSTDASEQLTEALSMSCVGAIQGLLAEAMDVATVTTDLDGNPLTDISNSCDFCSLILSTAAGRERCARSWRQQPGGDIYRCHAGLLCTTASVASNGHPVVLAVACQFTTTAPETRNSPWRERLPQLAADLGLPEAQLQAALGGVHVVPVVHLPRASKLVRRMAAVFAEIGQERQNLLGRLQKIAEMSKL